MDEILGPVRNPTNVTYQHRGSIHDDETAQKLGLRAGTIAASTHLDQFPPVLVEAFGQRWFRDGCLSLYFRHATTDGEPVQVRIERPAEMTSAQTISAQMTSAQMISAQTAARMTTPDDVLVAEGTASVGTPDTPSALSARDLRHDETGLRILGQLHQGDAIGPGSIRIEAAEQRDRIDQGLITEPLEWYRDASPWGGPVAPLSAIVDALTRAASASLIGRIGSAVGLWGAIEIRMWDGPVLMDTDYTAVGAVTALGDSPKTEILWYDVDIRDADRRVATMRILTRFMKASSPLYPA